MTIKIILLTFLILFTLGNCISYFENTCSTIQDCYDLVDLPSNGIVRGQYAVSDDIPVANMQAIISRYTDFCSSTNYRSYPLFNETTDLYGTATAVIPPRNNGLSFAIRGCIVYKLFCGSTSPITNYTQTPINDETLFITYSTSKFLVSLEDLIQRSNGVYSQNTPIASLVPGYGINGKANITTLQFFSNSAGVQVILPLSVSWLSADNYNRSAVEAAIIGAPPAYPPGSEYAYNPIAYGWIADMIFYHATSKNLSQLIYEDITQPLSTIGFDFEFHYGIRPWKLHH